MLELFIELTNQIFWDGYAHQLSADDPAGFQFKFMEFQQSYYHKQPDKSSRVLRPVRRIRGMAKRG